MYGHNVLAKELMYHLVLWILTFETSVSLKLLLRLRKKLIFHSAQVEDSPASFRRNSTGPNLWNRDALGSKNSRIFHRLAYPRESCSEMFG